MALDSPPGEPDDAEDAVPPLPPPVVYRHVRAIAARSKCRRPIHLPAFRSPCFWRDWHSRITPRGTGTISCTLRCHILKNRSEERRGGTECVRKCRSRGPLDHHNKNSNTQILYFISPKLPQI